MKNMMMNDKTQTTLAAALCSALIALAPGFATAAESQNQRPNIVIMIADDMSWDDLGCYGNTQVKTPILDRLAGDGLQFWNTYLTISSCSPSRNSILYGRYPHNTGAAELHSSSTNADLTGLPECLRNAGYFTICAGKVHCSPGIVRGFDRVDSKLEIVGRDGAASWLDCLRERPKDKPFFAWFATFDPHRGWDEKSEFHGTHNPDELTPPHYFVNGPGTRADLAGFYDKIARFDHNVGKVMDELKAQGIYENTIVIVMADNGRPFPLGKGRVTDRGLRIPFIVWNGGAGKGARCDRLVSAVDIAPTLLELAGTSIPESFQGVSFRKLLTNPEEPFRNYVFGEHNWHDFEAHERMVRDGDFMFILNSRPHLVNFGCLDSPTSATGRELSEAEERGQLSGLQRDYLLAPRPAEELYDLRKDPEQANNVAANPEYAEQLKRMRGILTQWMTETGDSIPEKLTPDWRSRQPPFAKNSQFGVRGEMPGAANNADTSNNKGPF